MVLRASYLCYNGQEKGAYTLRTQIIAHRGSKGAHPENTLPAFLHAVKVGADGIELDVQLSKDGQLVVIHDETVDRTTNGKGLVSQLALSELKRLDAGSWFNPGYSDTRLPTLKEVFETLTKEVFHGSVNVELKTDRYTYEGIEEKVVEFVRSEEWPFDLVFSSFNEATLQRLLEKAPDFSAALLFRRLGEEKTHVGRYPLSAWHPKITWLKRASVPRLNKMPLRVWTVNKEREMKQCFRMSVEAIIADFPEKTLEVREKY